MTYRKSDGPFGLLPKKTAMDLEGASGLYAVNMQREVEPKSHRAPELDPSITQAVEPGTRTSEAERRSASLQASSRLFR